MRYGFLFSGLMLLCEMCYGSAVFDGRNANLWLVDEHNNVTSFSYDSWLDDFLDVEFELGANQQALVNHVVRSSVVGSSRLAPLSLVGLNEAQQVIGKDVGRVPLTVYPESGEFSETIRITVSVDGGLLNSYKELTLSIEIDGTENRVLRFDHTSTIVDGVLGDELYLIHDGKSRVVWTLTAQTGNEVITLGQLDETYMISSAHPDGPQRDTDEDGLPDVVELAVGLDPLESNWQADINGDGWADFDQWLRSESGDKDRLPVDSDSDGWSNTDEIWRGTNPYDLVTSLASNDGVGILPPEGSEQYNRLLLSFKDRPVADRLYAVEYIHDLHQKTEDKVLSWNGEVTALSLTGDVLYRSGTLLTENQLVWADVNPEDIHSGVKKSSFSSLRDNEQRISIRTPGSKIHIVDIATDALLTTDSGDAMQRQYHRKLYPGNRDITPDNFVPVEIWETAKEWKALYIEHLKNNLVIRGNDSIGLYDGLYVDILQSLIQQELGFNADGEIVDFRELSLIQQQRIRELMDTLSSREKRNLWDVAQDIVSLLEGDVLLPLKNIILDTMHDIKDQPVDSVLYLQKILAKVEEERYRGRLMLFDEGLTQILSEESLLLPDADSDGDGIPNGVEILTPLLLATYPWDEDSDNDHISDSVDICPLNSVRSSVVFCEEEPTLIVNIGEANEPKEGESFLLVSFQIDRIAREDITIEYNVLSLAGDLAEEGIDFGSMQGSVTIEAGNNVVTILVPVYGDGLDEEKEHFHLVISNVENANYLQGDRQIALHDFDDTTVLEKPINLIANSADKQIALDWHKVEGAVGYRVYQGRGVNFSKESALLIAEITANTLSISDLLNERMYFYAVEAFRGDVVSPLSSVASGYPYNPSITGLRISQSLDFGHIPISSTKDLVFSIENVGVEPVVVSDLLLPEGFNVPDFNSGDIIEGDSKRQYLLTFNPLVEGQYVGRLEVITENNVTQGWFSVRGYGITEIVYPRMVSHVLDGQNGLPIPDLAKDIAISPAGDQVVIADTYNIQTYRRNPNTGDVRFDKTIPVEKGYSRIAKYSPSGDRLYLGSQYLLSYDRDVETGELSFRGTVAPKNCHLLNISASGKRIFCTATNGISAHVYTLLKQSSGAESWSEYWISAGGGDRIFGGEFTEDGNSIVLAKASGIESYKIDDAEETLVLADKIEGKNQHQAIGHLGGDLFLVADGYHALSTYSIDADGDLELQQKIEQGVDGTPGFSAFWITSMPETNSFVIGPSMLRFSLDETEVYRYVDSVVPNNLVFDASYTQSVWHSNSEALFLLRSDSHYASSFYSVSWSDNEYSESDRIRAGSGGLDHLIISVAGKNWIQLLENNQLALRNHTSPDLQSYSLDVSPNQPISKGNWKQMRSAYTHQYVTVSKDKKEYFELHHEYLSNNYSIHQYRWDPSTQGYLHVAEYNDELDNLEGAPPGVLTKASDIVLSPDGKLLVVTIGAWETAIVFLRNKAGDSLTFLDRIRDADFSMPGSGWRDVTFSPDSKQMFILASGAVYVAEIDSSSGANASFVIQNNEDNVGLLAFPKEALVNDAGTLLVVSSTQGLMLFDRNPIDGSLSYIQEISSSDTMFLGLNNGGSVTPMHFIDDDTGLLLAFSQGVFKLAESQDDGLWKVDWSIVPSTLGGEFPVDPLAFRSIVFIEPFENDSKLVVYGRRPETGVYVFDLE
ncbi:hypothetical protein A9Q99_04650 [Gammaproteobacteria bacterium 45_16_T64]|nr:hypothetical protein A9Q99_04650 [Gammaproteobacteria bacterium 45_16_T64]